MNKNAFSYTYNAACNQEVLNIRKKKFAPEILRLSDELLK